jgi:uncharacterized protein YjdB
MRKHRAAGRLAASKIAIWIAALAAGCTTSVEPPAVASVTLLPALDSLEAGSSARLFVVSARDAAGNEVSGRRVQWSSSNSAIATVDTAGTVAGVAPGQAFITATIEGKAGLATVKVLLPLSRIVLTPDPIDIVVGATFAINAQLLGPGGEGIAGRVITWSSANPAIATVSATGVVTAIAEGQTQVTATSGSKSASVRVIVRPEPAARVSISPSDPVQVLRLGQSRQLSAKCFGVSGNELVGRNITWTSNNPTVAAVSGSGLVSAVAVGQATVTADCGGPIAQVVIQVTPVPVGSVLITPNQLTILVGQQQQLSATPYDSAGNVLSLQGRQVIWTSNNLPVATVSAQGVVQGIAQGTAQIQVTVDNVPSQPITVTVQNVPVASVTVSPNPGQVRVGFQLPMSVVLRDANGNTLTGRTVIWRSQNPAVATVNQFGVVTGMSLGNVIIEAESEGIVGTAVVSVVP